MRICIVAVLCLPSFAAAAVPGPGLSAFLTGRVTDASTGDPLASATVMLADRSAGTATDAAGLYALAAPSGPCTLRVVLVGYAERMIPLVAPAGDTLRTDIALTPVSVEGEEVAVVGERAPIAPLPALNAVTVAPSRAASISGAFRDAYRTVQALPGVASNNEMASQFSVRGGSADQNLVLLNTTTLIEPFHLKESPNTSAAIVPLDLIGRLIFIPGGFPARYGDRLSAVLDMELRDGAADRFAGQAELALTNAGAIAEGPLGTGFTGIASFRSTYSDYVARYLPDGDRRRPHYYDLLAGLGALPAPGHSIAGRILYAADRTSGIASGSYSTAIASLQSTHALGIRDTLRVWASFTRQDDDLTRPVGIFGSGEREVTTRSVIRAGELRLRYEWAAGDHWRLVTGAEVGRSVYDVTRTERVAPGGGDPLTEARLNRTVTRPALYLENHVETGRLFINAGLRLDHATSSAETRLGPRLLASWRLPGGTRLKGAWGIYTQSPNQTQLLAAEQAGLPSQRMQRAVHYVLGVEHALRRDLSFRAEAYIRTLENLISFERRRSGEIVSSPRNDARGNVKGVEFEAAFSDQRVFGWINVAVMRAEELNLSDGKGWRLSPNDQRKTVTTVFEFRVAERWSLNLRAFYGSGFAYVDDLPGTPDLRMHYPEYKRADARVSHFFPLAAVSMTGYVEILNLFAHRNAFSFTGTEKNPLTPDVNLLLPMIINAGLKVQW